MPSRRVFKDRILREARAQQTGVVLDLTLSLSALTAASPLAALDRIPILTSGGQARYVLGSTARNYVLGIAGGTANIPENLAVTGTVTGGTYNGQTISAAASLTGTLTVASTLTTNGTGVDLSQSAASNASVNIGSGAQAGGAFLRLRRAAGQYGQIIFATGTSTRWVQYIDNTAESGGNVGGEWSLAAHSDAGAFIDNVLRVQRFAGGTAAWTRPNIFPAATTSIPSIRLPHGTAPSAPTNGDVWTTTAGLFARINGVTASLSGSNTGDQTITLTGDVTGSGTGSFAATIANDAVTYAKMQNVSAASRLLGRGSAAGAGDVQELTIGTGLSLSGTVLSSTVTGDVVGPASATDNAVVRFDATTGKLVQNSVVTIGDGGEVAGVSTLNTSGVITGDSIVSTTGLFRGTSGTGTAELRSVSTAVIATRLILYASNHATRPSDIQATTLIGGLSTEVWTIDAANGNTYIGFTGTTGGENVALNSPRSVNFQGMQRGVYLRAAQAPTGNPTSGGFLWVDSSTGDLKFRGPSGTITTIALA